MSRPFGIMVKERSQLSHDIIIRQAMSRLTKWQQVSGSKQVSLDDVAWLGAMFDVAFRQAQVQIQANKEGSTVGIMDTVGNVVHNVVLSDGATARDQA